jgi:hypothetical protein
MKVVSPAASDPTIGYPITVELNVSHRIDISFVGKKDYHV